MINLKKLKNKRKLMYTFSLLALLVLGSKNTFSETVYADDVYGNPANRIAPNVLIYGDNPATKFYSTIQAIGGQNNNAKTYLKFTTDKLVLANENISAINGTNGLRLVTDGYEIGNTSLPLLNFSQRNPLNQANNIPFDTTNTIGNLGGRENDSIPTNTKLGENFIKVVSGADSGMNATWTNKDIVIAKAIEELKKDPAVANVFNRLDTDTGVARHMRASNISTNYDGLVNYAFTGTRANTINTFNLDLLTQNKPTIFIDGIPYKTTVVIGERQSILGRPAETFMYFAPDIDREMLHTWGITDEMMANPRVYLDQIRTIINTKTLERSPNNVGATATAVANNTGVLTAPTSTFTTGVNNAVSNIVNVDVASFTQADFDNKANTNADNIVVNDWKNKLGLTDANGNDTYAKIDGSNITHAGSQPLINKLSDTASLDNPTGSLITDTKLKPVLDTLANKTLDNFNVNNISNDEKDKIATDYLNRVQKGNVVSSTIVVTNGTGRVIGSDDLVLDIDQNVIDNVNQKVDKQTWDTEKVTRQTLIDNKANLDGSNIIADQDKQDFRTNINVYSKTDVDNIFNQSVGGSVDVTNTHTAVSGNTVYNYLHTNYMSNQDKQNIHSIIDGNKSGIKHLEDRIKNSKSGMAGVFASANIPQITDNQKINVGVGLGHYKGKTGYALGISGRTNKGNIMYKASVGLGQSGKASYGVSIGYTPNKEFKDTRVNALYEENEMLEQEIQNLETMLGGTN